MKDNDIVKALECCTGKDGCCEDCPYEKCFTDDKNFLLEDALDLINRQNAEIERLQTENEEQDQAIINALHYMKTVRTEAYKYFAERSKSNVTYHEDECGEFVPWVDCRDIDNLVKEMTEGNSNGE